MSQSFPAPAAIELYMSGFIGEFQGQMQLEDVASGRRLAMNPAELPCGFWVLAHFRVPRSWQGHPVRLVASFEDATPGHWMSFSEPVVTENGSDARAMLWLLVRTLAYFGLLSLPFACGALLCIRRITADEVAGLLFGLALTGLAGYAVFWLWFASPKLGMLSSYALLIACGVLLALELRKGTSAQREHLRRALTPWFFVIPVALFILFAGFLWGGLQHPMLTAQARYSRLLPVDNFLPGLFAEQLAHGKIAHPFFLDWLTSDRPPLQTGLTLLLYPFAVTPRELRYEVTAVLAQSFWVPAIWALLRVLAIPRRLIVLTIVALVFSGFILLNNFYTWPKLLAAAFTIAGSALLLAIPRRAPPEGRGQQLAFAICSGLLLALGLLSHGGSAFAMFGLIAVLAGKTPRPRPALLAFAGAALVLTYLPWTAYQKFYDPPGDRLLKWHLAGVESPDQRPFSEVLGNSYSKLTWREILDRRAENAHYAFGHYEYWGALKNFILSLPHDLVSEEKNGGGAARHIRNLQFSVLSSSLGLFLFGPFFLIAGILRRFRTITWRAALVCWGFALGTAAAWLALLFEPGQALLHQGSYVTVLLAIAGSVLAYANVSRALAYAVVAAQAMLTFLAHVIYNRGVAPEGLLAEGAFDPAALLLLAGACALLLAQWRTTMRPRRRAIGQEARPSQSLMRLAPLVVVLLSSSWLVVPPTARAASGGFTLPQIMSTPFASGMTAAPKSAAVAWLVNSRGQRNIWAASGPNWQAKQITNFGQDDGQEIADLAWAPDGSYLLFARGGDFENGGENPNPDLNAQKPDQSIWRVDLSGAAAPVKLTEGQAPAISVSGQIVFTRKGQVFQLKNGHEAAPLLEQKGTQTDLRWSPDGARFTFVSQRDGHSFIGVFTLADSSVRYLDPSIDRDSEPAWSPDGSAIAFVRVPSEDRAAFFSAHRSGPPWSLRVADVSSGKGREVFRANEGPGSVFHGFEVEHQLIWAGDRLVFPWERTGWLHLYSVPVAGGNPVELTPGTGEVDHVGSTGDHRTIFYSTNIGDIDRRHLASVPADGSGKPQLLTNGSEIEWQPAPAADGSALLFLSSNYNQSAHAALRLRSGERHNIGPEAPSEFPAASLVKPQAVMITAADGLPLHGQLFLPPGGGSATRHPALIFFHGGSRRQMLLGFHYMYYYSNAYAMNQYLASQGYVVLSVNYRSGIGYGLDFREAINYGARGGSEFNDVMGAGLYMKSRDDVDPHRIGVWGGSYGGYLTAMALSRASDLFAAGVDFHGVHDWSSLRGYLTRGDASGDPTQINETHEAARIAFDSSPMASVDTWKSPVLLIHGDDDRNVEFAQTLMLAEALRKRGIPFEQLIFPNEIHDFLLHRHWVQAYQATADFFARKLKEPVQSAERR